jgi:hypothetical protein
MKKKNSSKVSDANKIMLIDINSTPFSDLFKLIILALISDINVLIKKLLFSG